MIGRCGRSSVIGTRSDLERLTHAELFEHYRTHYAPANAVLVIVGDVDTGAALNKGGRLTAFCAEERTFIQVDHYAKLIEVGPS